jgi:hypothetical protein
MVMAVAAVPATVPVGPSSVNATLNASGSSWMTSPTMLSVTLTEVVPAGTVTLSPAAATKSVPDVALMAVVV